MCTCGRNVRTKMVDIGHIGNWPLFPLVSLLLGDTGRSIEYLYFRVDPLVCEQGMFYKDIQSQTMVPPWATRFNPFSLFVLTKYSSNVNSTLSDIYTNNCIYKVFAMIPIICSFFSERTTPRWFSKKQGMRQNAEVAGIQGIKSVVQCGIACSTKPQECVGFNFKPGLPIPCELCRVPQDAPNANMAVDPTWNHYAIVPYHK